MPTSLLVRKFVRACAAHRPLALLCLSLLLAATLLPRASHGMRPQEDERSPAALRAESKKEDLLFVPGEILVRFREEAFAKGAVTAQGESTVALHASAGGREIIARVERLSETDEIVEGLRLAHVQPEDTLPAIEALRARPDVIYAEPNFIRRVERVPNDPRYSSLWAMKNTGNPNFDINAEEAWNTTTGDRKVVVGVIDEGIDINHQDLRDNIWRNPGEVAGNGFDDDGNGYADDINGWDFRNNDRTVYDGPGTNPDGSPVDAHGTHVAGTIGATGDNGIGVVGVNWQTSLMSLKFIGADGGRSSDLLRAYGYARMMRQRWETSGGTQGANIRVLNNSYGGAARSQAEEDAIRTLGDAGILFVAAAGNDSTDNDRYPHYPSGYALPNVISVAATASYGSNYSGTNYGARTVHLFAPGQSILSTTPGNTYSSFTGTSMASPHVAGTAALVCAAHPNISLTRLRAAVLYTGTLYNSYPTATITNRRLNAANALQSAAGNDTSAPGAVGNLRLDTSATAFDPLLKTFRWTTPGDDGNAGNIAHYEVRYSDVDLSSPEAFERARPLAAQVMQQRAPGEEEAFQTPLPYRISNIFIGVRALDEAGNAGPISSLQVSLPPEISDPYVVSQEAASQLSTGGTPLNLRADDQYADYRLPFRLSYFNILTESVRISTNGAIYIPGYYGNELPSLAAHLPAEGRIAGLWDDLRTDRRAGDDVYVVRPDDDRIIFRWQAVTFDTPLSPTTTRGENSVAFEIEIRRDGTIITRYGDGNTHLWPVVGLSAGRPEAYTVTSHTSDISTGVLKNLTYAPAIVYTRRAPTPAPQVDVAASLYYYKPNLATQGQQVKFDIRARNFGDLDAATGARLVVELSPGLSFVSCEGGSDGTCANAGNGTLTVDFGQISPHGEKTVVVVAEATGLPGSLQTLTARVNSRWNDPNTSNNTVTAFVDIAQPETFGSVKSVAAGGSNGSGGHSLALKSDGTVWGWGRNQQGQLGNTFYTNSEKPVQVPRLSGITAIAAGAAYSLALNADGTLMAWGTNDYGQLGVNQTQIYNSGTPLQVADLSGVVAVSAKHYHSLALKSDGTVWGWGANNSGEAGGGISPSRFKPTQVTGLNNVVAVSAGVGYSLALKSDGTVWGWGANSYGQLGLPVNTPAVGSTPTQVPGLSDVTAIATSFRTSYALKRDGTVWSWGYGLKGERGDGTSQDTVTTPRQVQNLSNVAAIQANNAHAFALKTDGTLWGWGDNYYNGTVGDGAYTWRTTPAPVLNLPGGVVYFSTSNTHTLAVLTDGTVRAWGLNYSMELGDRTDLPRFTPVALSVLAIAPPVTLSPNGGTFNAPVTVTFGNVTPGTIIRYSTGGLDPDESSPILAGNTLLLEYSTLLKARAWKDGVGGSSVTSAGYTITAPPASTIFFSRHDWRVSESDKQVVLTVNRTGDTTKQVSADYATYDDARPVACNDNATASGVAFARCDYATTVDTITFAPGETTKTITIPLIDDAYRETTETFAVNFTKVTGALVEQTGRSWAEVSIEFNDQEGAPPNPIFNSNFFVRQQYLDFLSREPDQGGLDAWTGVLARCSDVNNNPACDRNTVSSSFFRSTEFQLKGFFVYRFYKLTLGRLPKYTEIVADMSKVTGQTSEEVFAKREAFAREWLTRYEFRSSYDRLSNAGFVYALMKKSGVTLDSNVTADSLTIDLQAGRKSRAEVLRLIVEHPSTDAREYNGAFVAMQYFGYLRRDPEEGGYNAWLNYLNAHPDDFRTMVGGFMNSAEYRLRFGTP